MKKTDYGAELKKEYGYWNQLFCEGGRDPFWPDGVNLNLIRNHIIACKIALGREDREKPEEYGWPLPPELSPDYMARKKEIWYRGIESYQKYITDDNYLYLKEGSGNGRFIVTGVRWAESYKRKQRGIYESFAKTKKDKVILNNDNDDRRQLFESCRLKSKHVCNPIIDWRDRDVWEYIRAEKIPVNPLYDMGFFRVGCIGCPMAGKQRYREFAQFPTYKRAYIRAFEQMLLLRKQEGKDDSIGKWKDAQGVFRWWMEEDPMPGQYELLWDEETDELY